ncbi:coatomer protein complex, subunit alpha (xenin) [Angomonas deanei]|nr:coatomer protein complex, subunit alpha (xenin) [Angomonas deanei]|eukprot:EPY42876.1 coatomer protein complex, subunit alpha (xenin) [Angomonas deanei]
MLSKLDVRSSRVKGITFHKQRPWVLCGLHNGVVQIWDYSMNTSVDTFYISNGGVPTRGVDFHESQPLFVTGSDDHLVRVWNYKLRRCMYTLAGHVDYIRTTFFHHNQPWILSSSDDYIIRIWNWQSRACIAMLPGHLHYVMCAQFHPTQPLVASASLDKTIKVWDISKLQFRKQEAGVVQDLLGTSDVEVKYTLEGHEKAVNWVSFHPTHSYLVSASDDRTVRVWSYSDSGFYNETTLRGHTHNVCCATYFKGKYIISCGEDRVIKVFAVGGNSTAIMTFRRELDRYWILATYASKNLIAAGHDTGLQVFKLFRERPPFAVSQNQLTYIHENQLFVYDFKSESDTKFNLPGKMLRPPYALSVNPSASQIVVCLKDDSNYVDLIDIPKAGFSASLKAPNRKTDVTEATFFGPNKYVYIDANGGLFMHSLTGEKDKSLGVPFVCTKLFPAPTGCVLCQSEENIYIYQVAQHASIAEAPAVGTRQAVWDKGFHKVALLSKNAIEIRTKRLKLITTVRELTSRIKSAVFDETRDVLFYTTSNHIKYCILRTGEVSTICTLKTVVYLVAAVGDKVWMLTRSGKVLVKELDNLELNFKLKLQQQSFREVMKIIQSRELKGQALVGYLHKHNYSEIALHFAKEPLTRFNLALECGAIDIAKEAAMELDDASVWRRLSETAITFGDIQLSQLADSKANNYHASAMHMLYTGNLSALGHLVDSVQDDNFKLQYGLYLNDYEQRIQLLLNANQLPLAYLTAKSNGLEEVAANIYSKMSDEVKKNIDQTECPKSDPSPKPTPQTDNWPMLQVEESIFTKLLKQTGELDVLAANVEELDDDAADAWGDGDDDDLFKEMDEEGGFTSAGCTRGGGGRRMG